MKSKYSFEQHYEFALSQKGIRLPEVYAQTAAEATEEGHVQRVDAAFERWDSARQKNGSAPGAGEPMPGELVPALLVDFLSAISKTVNHKSFASWFEPITEMSRTTAKLYFRVPSEVFRDWIISNYASQMEEALEELSLTAFEVEFVI